MCRCGKNLAHLLCISLCMCALHTRASAQQVSDSGSGSKKLELVERFAFKTNAMDWLITVPNFQLAFDITPSVYNQNVALLGLKYNWNTYHNYLPFFVFNMMDIRPEFRHYYRHKQRGFHYDENQKQIWDKVQPFSNLRKKPDAWKAFYVGLYGDFFGYALKPWQTGWQGYGVGVGISAGYEVPLYQYKKGAIDLDLGLSAGLIGTWNKAFTIGEDSKHYTAVPEKDVKFLVLPMITEVRAVFTWRRKSVQYRYLMEDPSKEVYRDKITNIDNDVKMSTYHQFWEYAGEQKQRLYSKDPASYRRDYMASLEILKEDLPKHLNDDRLSQGQKERLKAYMNAQVKKLERDFTSMLGKLEKQLAKDNQAKARDAELKAEKKALKDAEDKSK